MHQESYLNHCTSNHDNKKQIWYVHINFNQEFNIAFTNFCIQIKITEPNVVI